MRDTCTPELQDTALTDISAQNLDMVYRLVERYLLLRPRAVTATLTAARRSGANYVFVRPGVGARGLQPTSRCRSGTVSTARGDTRPRRIMHAQRTIPVLLDF